MSKRTIHMMLLGLVILPLSRSAVAQDEQAKEMAKWTEAQEHHVTKMFELYFAEVQDENKLHMTMRITDDLLNTSPNHTLDLLENYVHHASSRVRFMALGLARRLGEPSSDMAIRRRAVAILVDGCLNKVGGSAARMLLNFKPSDFDGPEVSLRLWKFLDEPINRDLLLVLGVADRRDMLEFLEKLSDKHYAAVLARARLGDDDAARQAIDRVRNAKNPRLLMQHYLEQLGYTRHPIVLAYLTAFLDRSDRLIDVPASDYYVPRYDQLCTQIIAKNFRECPVKYEKIRFRVTDADIAAVKTWAKKKLRESAED